MSTSDVADDDMDIVDALSDATGFFHDDDAARLREIAAACGQKPVGVVKAGVEREIERREWRCVYFDSDEGREYPPSNAFEYYRAHRAFQLEYEAALDALPSEQSGLHEVQRFEHAAKTLEDTARRHEAKADRAERYLRENGLDVPEVSLE